MFGKMLNQLFKSHNIWTVAQRGDIDAIRRLAAAGADVNEKKRTISVSGWRPLHFAADAGQVETIKELVRLGAKVDAGDDQGDTPLMRAVEKNRPFPVIDALLELGANVNKYDKHGITVLDCAVVMGQEDMVGYLLKCGADLKGPKGSNLRGPLVEAVSIGNTKILEMLLAAGAQVNSENGKDCALSTAATFGKSDIVQRLLSAHANPNHKDHSGCTPLMAAVRGKNADIVRAMLNAGADVNAASEDGMTSLDRAREMKLSEIIQIIEFAGGKFGRKPGGTA